MNMAITTAQHTHTQRRLYHIYNTHSLAHSFVYSFFFIIMYIVCSSAPNGNKKKLCHCHGAKRFGVEVAVAVRINKHIRKNSSLAFYSQSDFFFFFFLSLG